MVKRVNPRYELHIIEVYYTVTINVPLILKVRAIIFFLREQNTYVMGHFEGFFEGASKLTPKLS
jgi:hypothetical protein